MKKIKKALMSFGILMLTTSCDLFSTIGGMDPEELQDSVNRLNERDPNSGSTYYNYVKAVNEARGDNYLSENCRQQLMPTGGFALNDSLVDVTSDLPNYTRVILPGQKGVTSENDIVFKANNLDSSRLGRYRLELEYSVPTTFASAPLIQVKVNLEAVN